MRAICPWRTDIWIIKGSIDVGVCRSNGHRLSGGNAVVWHASWCRCATNIKDIRTEHSICSSCCRCLDVKSVFNMRTSISWLDYTTNRIGQCRSIRSVWWRRWWCLPYSHWAWSILSTYVRANCPSSWRWLLHVLGDCGASTLRNSIVVIAHNAPGNGGRPIMNIIPRKCGFHYKRLCFYDCCWWEEILGGGFSSGWCHIWSWNDRLICISSFIYYGITVRTRRSRIHKRP